jgi:transcriptional regulator with XRE-family HTH domain
MDTGRFAARLVPPFAPRDKQGVTQDQLAIGCDFDRTYPSLLERELRQPTLHTLLRLADALDIGATELVAETVSRLRAAVQRFDPSLAMSAHAWSAPSARRAGGFPRGFRCQPKAIGWETRMDAQRNCELGDWAARAGPGRLRADR